MKECCICQSEITDRRGYLMLPMKGTDAYRYICPGCRKRLKMLLKKRNQFWRTSLRIIGWLFFLCACAIGITAGILALETSPWSGILTMLMGALIGLMALAVVQVVLGMEKDGEKYH